MVAQCFVFTRLPSRFARAIKHFKVHQTYDKSKMFRECYSVRGDISYIGADAHVVLNLDVA